VFAVIAAGAGLAGFVRRDALSRDDRHRMRLIRPPARRYKRLGTGTWGEARMKALDELTHRRAAGTVDWRKAMSDNVAIALIVYTGLQIFLTVEAIKETGLRSLSMLCLIILVAAIIPACHKLEKRWRDLSENDAHDEALAGAYRRDQILLWVLALGLPFALTFFFRTMA
jgi:hypothetical protein